MPLCDVDHLLMMPNSKQGHASLEVVYHACLSSLMPIVMLLRFIQA